MSDKETIGPIDPDTGRFKGVPEPRVTEEIEAAGQAAFVNSTTLPIRILGRYLADENRVQSNEEAEADIDALGVVLGAPVDETFRNAVLPPGWTKAPSDHAMWSYVRDETGADRIAVFFKAAPYDYRAEMRIA